MDFSCLYIWVLSCCICRVRKRASGPDVPSVLGLSSLYILTRSVELCSGVRALPEAKVSLYRKNTWLTASFRLTGRYLADLGCQDHPLRNNLHSTPKQAFSKNNYFLEKRSNFSMKVPIGMWSIVKWLGMSKAGYNAVASQQQIRYLTRPDLEKCFVTCKKQNGSGQWSVSWQLVTCLATSSSAESQIAKAIVLIHSKECIGMEFRRTWRFSISPPHVYNVHI